MLLSRIVVRRKKNARVVLAAIKVHGAQIGARLNQLFADLRAEGEIVVEYLGVLADLANALKDAVARLEHADWAHLSEVANDRWLRRLRDTATLRLQQTLLKISRTVDSTYGEGIAEEVLGLGAGLRAEPELMYEIGRRLSATLGAEDFRFPVPGLGGVELVPAELKTEIDGPLGELATALANLGEEKKKFDRTLKAKLHALEDFDKTYSRVANILRDLFGFAGEEMYGERVRPTTRQPPTSTPEAKPEDGENPEPETAEETPEPDPRPDEAPASPADPASETATATA